MNLDYRTMFNTVIGPILHYFHFHINENGIIQKTDDDIDITLSGKHLYVPTDGFDTFNSLKSDLIVPFNPFKIKEHLLILSKFLCSEISNNFRDEDDVAEFTDGGEMLDIVTLIKRNQNETDKLSALFNGVIYEIWCRDGEDVLGKGIDNEGNDNKAILIAILNTLSNMSNLVAHDTDYEKLFRYINKVEDNKDNEMELARSQYSAKLTSIDFNDGMNSVDVTDKQEEETNSEIINHDWSNNLTYLDEIEF